MTNDRAMIGAEGDVWPTYADRVEIAYKAFEIGLWELSRDNHVAARRWLRDAVDYGVEDARPLLDICVNAGMSTPAVPTTPDPPTVPDASTLGTFAADFAARPTHERRAAHNWFPRRQLAILRSVALLTIRTRELVRAMDRARNLDRDRILARDVDRDPALTCERTNELANALTQAHDHAVELRHALDRDRAGELAYTRDLVRDLARDLAGVRDRIFDRDLAHVLSPVRDSSIVTSLNRVREDALVHASKLALERAIDPVRARHAYLAHARDLDQATALADDFVRALEHNGGHDNETFDRELIEAVERLETALTPATQPRDGREAG